MMNDKFGDAVTRDTIKDDDVQFYWCISSASMSQDCKHITGEDSQQMDHNQRVLIRQNDARNIQERNKERYSEVKSS